MSNSLMESFAFGGREVDVIDLSDLLSNATTAFESLPHHIDYTDHAGTIPISERKWGMGAEYWRAGLVWAQETVTLCSHSGTHIDAPYHYAPTSGGAPARTIEQVPLRWCMGDGFVLDRVGVDLVRGITQDDIERELERIDYRIKPYDIALIRTDVWKFFKQPGYDQKHPGMRESATRYLVDAGVKSIGIDAWSFDRTLDIMVAEAKAGAKRQLWEAHYFGAIKQYRQIEKLCHLDAIPRPHGFAVVALPIKLERASAGWSRVVAICPRAGGPQARLVMVHPDQGRVVDLAQAERLRPRPSLDAGGRRRARIPKRRLDPSQLPRGAVAAIRTTPGTIAAV